MQVSIPVSRPVSLDRIQWCILYQIILYEGKEEKGSRITVLLDNASGDVIRTETTLVCTIKKYQRLHGIAYTFLMNLSFNSTTTYPICVQTLLSPFQHIVKNTEHTIDASSNNRIIRGYCSISYCCLHCQFKDDILRHLIRIIVSFSHIDFVCCWYCSTQIMELMTNWIVNQSVRR